MPAHWQRRAEGKLFLGIDHSAIGVSDSAASIVFYEGLGLQVAARSVNTGIEQDRLDAVEAAHVEVTALQPEQTTPHVELLSYRSFLRGRIAVVRSEDVAAARLVFEANGPSADGATASHSLIDPDGHHLVIEAPSINLHQTNHARITACGRDSSNRGNPHDRRNRNILRQIDGTPVIIHKLLTGQKALVTGANSGIGKGVAIALGQAGADVVVNYVVGDDAAEAVVEEIRSAGVKAYAHKADVSSEEQVAAMFERMMQEFGTIDILVNNAGLQRDAAFHEMTLEQWNKVLERQSDRPVPVRARGGAGVPAPRRGSIGIVRRRQDHLHEFGASGDSRGRGHANYAASKGGIKLLMESMAQELAPHRIRVNAIAPGAIRTPINTAAWQTTEAYDQLMTLVPYGRIGEPEDIARAAVWLASDHSDYVVGTTLFVDGGMTLYPGFATGG